ncbi:MAG: hypothetical protein BAA04_00890 [Firmicutes bacterium ZCTH02-B6]|nr:MAG: hypothetical protein BAA04_00890 [Firmicutes bacterium ZCTH02-B6]
MARHPISGRLHPTHRAVRRLFPKNVYVQRLLAKLESLNVGLGVSTEPGQWLYHPAYRTLWVWEPDLSTQPLSYLVVILAHELGHVLDFDEKPLYRAITKDLHWTQVPDEIECSAFVRGFWLLQELQIPVDLGQYLEMIDTPMALQVGWELLAAHPWAAQPFTFRPWDAGLPASVSLLAAVPTPACAGPARP